MHHTLVCPFLSDDPTYARGVEFGLLCARMGAALAAAGGGPAVVRDYFLLENQEQILLLANRTGWTVAKMELWAQAPHEWFWLELRHK